MNSAAQPSTPSVAQIIVGQLGRKALFMMGAKDLMAAPAALTFKIRGSKFCNQIQISLAADDTYTISFFKIRGISLRLIENCEGVYVDSMHQLISSKTGLYLSL